MTAIEKYLNERKQRLQYSLSQLSKQDIDMHLQCGEPITNIKFIDGVKCILIDNKFTLVTYKQ